MEYKIIGDINIAEALEMLEIDYRYENGEIYFDNPRDYYEAVSILIQIKSHGTISKEEILAALS